MFISQINRDPNEQDEAGSFQDAISNAMDTAEQETPESKENESNEGKEENAEGTETENKWDGKTDRRSKFSGQERRNSALDPEHELDFEMEPGKGKAKFKTSELKEAAKFIHANKDSIAGALKIREMAAKHPEFGKILQTVIGKSFNGENFNQDFATKTLSALEGKAEKIEDKIDDKEDDIKEMQTLLDELDQDSPQAKILARNIANQKAQRSQLQNALNQINEMKSRVDGIEQKNTDFLKKQETEHTSVEVKRLSETFSKEIGALTDAQKKDGYKFIDADEQAEFDSTVRNIVASNAKNIKTDADFVKSIQDAAKAVYDKMSKRREAYVNDYLKKKGQTPKTKDEEKPKQKKENDDDSLNGKTIGETIADAMFAESA